MGNLLCMGLFLHFGLIPTPRSLDGPDHRLAARMNMDMLDCHLLLALAAMLVEGGKLAFVYSHQPGRMFQVLIAPFKRLALKHRPPEALHRRIVGRDHLRGEHAFHFVARRNAFQGRHGRGGRFQCFSSEVPDGFQRVAIA